MRILVLISADNTVRNFVETGAFGGLTDHETFYVSSARGVSHSQTRERLRELPNYVGEVDDPRQKAKRPYRILRLLLLAATRHRSRTMRHKLGMLPRRQRLKYQLAALPGLRQAIIAAIKRRTGVNRELHSLMERIRPDLVLAPSNGYDPLVWDGLRSAKSLGIPTAVLIANWDNLSSKGIFAIKPEYLAVWGQQSVEHADRIHDIPAHRVRVLGAPAFEHYFSHQPGTGRSPFDFPYVLFAGCFAPFDERSALERLDRLIEREGIDLKVVYRPHPHRFPRNVPDFVDEARFEHVVIDPQVRDLYEASSREFENWNQPGRRRLKPLLPPLSYYPALLEHARFMVCPLSTMIVEAAIFERRVAVVAYDDGIHVNSPAAVVDYDHFEGIDRIDGFTMCSTPEAMDDAFLALAREPAEHGSSLREQLRWWLHFDDRPYGERLRAWVEEIGEREGIAVRRP